MIRDNASRWGDLLSHPRVRERSSDGVWSALEYGCHVRDVFALYDFRLKMMLDEDDPTYPNWDQNITAIEKRYDEQDPAHVLNELRHEAQVLSEHFDGLSDADWTRTGTRSDGARFTIESFGRYLIHDPVHHVNDVERGFARLRSGN